MKNFALLALAVIALAGCGSPTPSARKVENLRPTVTPQRLDELVAFHEERVQNDPTGALGLNMLAEARLAVASERDDDQMAIKAESAARQSLKMRRRGNESAAMILARSLLAQHRFADALAAADQAVAIHPSHRAAQRLRLEILLELGRYDEFRKSAQFLEGLTDPASLGVRARWAEINGNRKSALDYWKQALEQVEGIKTLPGGTVAWYRIQHGAALFRAGETVSAKSEFETALSLHPTGYQAHGWLARLAAGEGDWKEVLAQGELARKTAKLTDIEGLMVRAERHLGLEREANVRLAEMKRENGAPETLSMAGHSHASTGPQGRHTHSRLLAVALADLGEMPAYAHHTAEEDLANRRDVHALDAFAWTTYRYWELVPASVTGEGDGLLMEAKKFIDEALKPGIEEPKMLFHAGLIYRSLDKAKSDAFLRRALEINPKFDGDEVRQARDLLGDKMASR